jgi:hypothetical protein
VIAKATRVHKIELSPEQRRIEHLIAFSNSLSDESWSYDGDVIAEQGSRTLRVHGRVSWAQHHGDCVLDADFLFGHHLQSSGSYGRFIADSEYVSLASADGSWKAAKANVTSTDSSAGHEVVKLRPLDLAVGDLEARTTSLALVLAGADLDDWPQSFPKDGDGSRAAADGMVTRVFHRDALIRRMPTKTEAGYDVLVAFDGEPLEPRQQSALWLVMSFLAGREANFVGCIGIDGDREVWRTYHRWDPPLHKARPPLDPRRWNRATFDMPARLPAMLEHALKLLNENIPVDVALSHLFADSRKHSDTEIRDISLALDSLVEASAFDSKETTVIDPDEYMALLPQITEAIARALNGHPCENALHSRIMERVKGANDVSHGERRRKFWQRVGFELKPDEKDALDNRHPMSHAGYVLRGADIQEHQALSDQVRLARTLVDRVILALLGYDGPVLDYTSRLTQPWKYFIDRDGSRK